MNKFPGHGAPLHQQIASELRHQIANGELRPGDPLPSEHQLMQRFGVSRGTVRQARASLRAAGIISGSQGRRLAVNAPQLTQPLGELIGFSAWAESLGKTPSARVLEFGLTEATGEAACALDLQPGAAVYRVLRLRFADGEPLMIERTVFPERVGRLLQGVDLDCRSIYTELATRGVSVATARHQLGAIAASRADARLLQIVPGSPLLRIRRLTFAARGEPVEWAEDHYRGDQVDFTIENSAIVAGASRRLSLQGET